MKETTSVCPICYERIPATVGIGEVVTMTKICPEHGLFTEIVETSAAWWQLCQEFACTNIYAGYMLDVTGQCNIKCRYCYHDNSAGHRDAQQIITDAREHRHLGPTILTGGEPTLHPDLTAIVRTLAAENETWILTNGVRLADEAYFDEMCGAGLLHGNILSVGLSFHKESHGKDLEVLKLCRRKGLKLGTTFYVIDNLDQLADAVALAREYQDVIYRFRIKAASNLWAETGASNKIFTSDMIGWLMDHGETSLIESENNKVSYANVLHDGLHLILVSWYDANNVDLNDIDCGPWYMAADGTVNNLATTCILNGRRA